MNRVAGTCRFSRVDRVIARSLVVVTVTTSVWSIAPPVFAAPRAAAAPQTQPSLAINSTPAPGDVTTNVGQAVTVTVSDGPANTFDWVGLFVAGAPDTAYLDWNYLSGAKSAPAAGLATATLTFTAPTTPTDYEFRLFANGGYTRLATSGVMHVGPSQSRLTVNGVEQSGTVSVPIGTAVSVDAANGPGNPTDWVGLFESGAADTQYLSWQYFTGSPLTFVLPSDAGNYEFRFFASNGSLRLATSATVVLTASPARLTVNGVAAPDSIQLPAGTSATVAVTNGPANARDWVGLYTVGAADTAYHTWQYLSGTTPPASGLANGTLHFTLPTGEADYEFRLFSSDTFTRLTTSGVTSVVRTATVTVDSAGAAGGTANVTVAHGPGNATDWVGLFVPGSGDTGYLDWRYLNGSQAAPPSGVTDGVVTFPLATTAGTYEIRLFADNGYGLLATSSPIVVSSTAHVTVNGVASGSVTIAPGTNFTVAVTGGPGNTTDWIGIAPAGSPDASRVDWLYLNGSQAPPAQGVGSASVTFATPATTGEYEARLFARDGYSRLATGPTVTVSSATQTTPTIQLAAPAPGAIVKGPTVNATGTFTDATSVSVNGVAATIDGTSFTAEVPVSDGAVTLDAVARDNAGRTAPASTLITVDSAPPVITVLQPADGGYTNASDVDVRAGVSDATAVSVTVNGVNATAGSDGIFTATVPAGNGVTTSVAIVATDAAGNVSQTTVTLHVDRAPPAIAITSPVEGAYRQGPVVEVTGTVTDASPVLVDVNGQTVAANGGNFSTTIASGDGPLTIAAVATDRAGNTTTAQRSIVVDSVAPAIAVTSPADGAVTNQTTAHLTGTIADASPVTLRVGASLVPVTNGAFATDVTLGPDGDRTVTLRATDAAGNESAVDFHATVDQTPPDVQIASPAAGAIVGSLPVPVQGVVYDATATTVTVNGVAATRVPDLSWQAAVDGLAEGPQLLTVTATDAAGNKQTVTRNITVDVVAPTINIVSPAPQTITNGATVDVSGTATDTTLASVTIDGVATQTSVASGFSRTFSASVPLLEGDNHVVVVATDALARISQAEVVVTRDSTAPTVSIASPESVSRGRGATATIAAADAIGLANVTVTLNGSSIGASATAPFDVPITVPTTVAAGTTVTLVAIATDRAGNTATATHDLRVLAGGVVVGQVLSDVTGLPLSGATITTATKTTTSDERGGYSLSTDDDTAIVTIARDGLTTVERQMPVQTGVGTAMVDARLTPLAAAGLTPLSAQGLPALLPLGWSPVAAFDVRGNALGSPVVADLSSFQPPAPSPILITYRTSAHAWFVVAQQVTIDANAHVTFNASTAGAYALVVPDVLDPPIPIADVDQPLTGVSMVELPATATASGTVSPAALPPSGGTAAGTLSVQSPLPLPSGTIIQAQVTESYALSSGQTASEEQRTADIYIYRSAPADGSTLTATFPITPSRTYTTTDLSVGTVHLDILAGRESVRGQIGGTEPVSVDAGGGVTLTVPANALASNTAVRVQPAILSTFLPGATANTAPDDVVPVGEVVVDLSSQRLTLTAELTVAAPSDVVSGFSRTYLVGRVVRVDGIPRILVVARAEISGDRLVSRAMVGLPGIAESGRYVFYRVGGDVGFVTGLLSASGSPVAGVIESDSLPFIGIAGADGHFSIATRAADVRLTGRVTGTALQGTATVTTIANTITARDIVLAGAVTTATVTPTDGATLVPVTTQLEVLTSAPIDFAASTSATITLSDVAAGSSTAIRRVLSGSGRVLAIVPIASLQAATTYRLDVSGLTDVYGGAVAVAPVTFTTKADSAAVFDPGQVTVSFPDDNGIVHITAPPGVVPPLTNVLVVNAGNGVVASFQAGNDGSMSHELTASIRDRLIVTITDPQGRTFSFERSTYVAPDGTTGVGAGGGTVKSATTDATIDIPDGAIDDSAIFKIDGFDLSQLFPDDPDIAALLGAAIGSSVKIDAPPDLSLNQEAHLSFAKPDGVTDAAYFVYRRLQGPDGKIAYETIDEASEDPDTGKIVTHSPPFSGYTNAIDSYGPGGVGGGGGSSYMTMMYSAFDQAMPGRVLMGVITGKVLRQVLNPGSATPSYEPVANAIVSGTDASGEALVAKTTGASAAISQKDGTFTLFDPHYQGGQVTLIATTPDGDSKSAVAFESNAQDLKSPGLGKYRNIATANITFPAKAPAAPPGLIDIKVFSPVNDVLKETPVVVAGTPVTFGFDPHNGNVATASIQGVTLSVRSDVGGITHMPQVADGFTPAAPGSYTVTATGQTVSGSPVTVSAVFRAIASGGTATTNLPNDAPAVVSGLTVPRANETGVSPTVFPQVTFTEPVKRIPGHFNLTAPDGTIVPSNISGIGPDGPVADVVNASQVVTSLTLQPLQPLLFNTRYTLMLTSDIVDLDVDASGQPAPKPLLPFSMSFTTFAPDQIGASTEDYSSPSIVVLGDRGYLAVAQPNQTGLKIFDVSDPTAPTEILPSQPVLAIGYPYDLIGEDDSPLNGGRVVALTTGPIGIPYRPSNVFLYDVSTDEPQWIGAVTLGNSPSDGVTRRTVMKDGMLYAATAGIGKGIQVVDLGAVTSDFQTATIDGTTSPAYYQMLSQLGLEGQGFGQDAIVNTIFVDTGSGDNSRLWDLAVDDVNVDGVPTRIVAATGAHALAIVDPTSTEVLYNGAVVGGAGNPMLTWGYAIALTQIGARNIAAMVGFVNGASNLVFVTVDVTDPRHPVALDWIPLAQNEFDQRTRLLIKDGIVYVGGIAGTSLIDITDPVHIRRAGTINGLSGTLALSATDPLVFSVGTPLAPGEKPGLKTAATSRFVYLAPIQPIVVKASDSLGGPVQSVVARDVKVIAIGVPDEGVATVSLTENGIPKLDIPMAKSANFYIAQVTKGTQFARNSTIVARGGITSQGAVMFSAPRKLDIGEVTLTVDANNDTVLDETDDEPAKRQGKAWAFWEAAAGNYGRDEGMVDLATIRLTLKVGTPALRLWLKGDRAATTWSLSKKMPVRGNANSLAYIQEPPSITQKSYTADSSGCLDNGLGLTHCKSSGGAAITLKNLPRGTHEFLLRCESCPTDTSRMLRVEYAEVASDPTLLDAANTDIRPLADWMTVYTVHGTGDKPLPEMHPVDGWHEVDAAATNLTVMIHGFAVSESAAATVNFPTWFKKMYWSRYHVLSAQTDPHYVVGVAWPGNDGMIPQLNYVDSEFRAFETSMPVAKFLTELRSAHAGSLNVLAHSAGTIVANNAIQQLPDGTVDDLVMLESAVPVESFVDDYDAYRSATEYATMVTAVGSAGFDGYPNDSQWDAQWQTILANRNKPIAPPESCAIAQAQGLTCPSTFDFVKLHVGSNATDQQVSDFFTKRWRKAGADRGYSPWTGIFIDTPTKTRIHNFFNSGDQVLIVTDTSQGPWLRAQIGKPNGPENTPYPFWLDLEHTDPSELTIFGDIALDDSQLKTLRKWSELAFWFQPTSWPAGSRPIPLSNVTNGDYVRIGGTGGLSTAYSSHTYPTTKQIWETWTLFDDVVAVLSQSTRRPPSQH